MSSGAKRKRASAKDKNRNEKDIDDTQYLQLDKIDIRIMDLMLKEKTNKAIAEETKIPLSTIQRRANRIVKDGLVNQKAELNYERINITKAYLFIEIVGRNHHSVAKELMNIKQIAEISITLFNFDLVCTVLFKNAKELLGIIASTKSIEGIEKVLIAQEVNRLTKETNTFVKQMISPINDSE